MTPAERLRVLLARPGILVMPGCHDAMSARLIEAAGFEIGFMSGFAVSADRLGMPDTGLISYAELVDQGQNICRAASIPLIGDGDTDIPSMKMVTSQGGCAIAVLDPYQWTEPRSLDKVARLIAEDRVSYVAPADYQPQSQLDVIVKGALGRIALRAGLKVDA